jgi:hypothetical protein
MACRHPGFFFQEITMKKLLTLAVLALAVAAAGSASATIDWAGNAWPTNGANVVPTGPVDVYVQVYKSGVTDSGGQGAGITGVLYYTTDIAAQAGVAMTYNTDIGNNDEYTAQVPQTALVGAAWVDVDVVFTDASDASEYAVTTVRYNVIDVLPNDVTVSFTMCLGIDTSAGDVCVIGSAPEIGTWGSGVTMTDGGGGLYTVDVVFAAGGNPSFEYKYQKDGCSAWESVGNHLVTLPTDGTTSVVLAPDSWNNQPLGCGLGNVLAEDKVVCFQVCMTGVANSGGIFAVGNIPALDSWGTGITAVEIAPDLYQACIVLSAGSPMPINIEYKFKKDDCATWESVGNRLLTIDNSSPASQTTTNTWDDGPGACAPVPVEGAAWGTIKGMYR